METKERAQLMNRICRLKRIAGQLDQASEEANRLCGEILKLQEILRGPNHLRTGAEHLEDFLGSIGVPLKAVK